MTIAGIATAGKGRAQAIANVLSPRRLVIATADGVRVLWKYRALCGEIVRRDLTGQFANQVLGSFWVIGHPLSLLAIYVFVFAIVLKVKIPVDAAMPRDYTVYILAGIVPWLAISQALGRGTTALMAQPNLVKQVVFPVDVLPPASVFVSLVPMVVSVPVIIAYQLLTGQGVPMILGILPIFIVVLFLFLSGIAFFLSAITPFFRDTKDFVTVFVTAGVYLIPAFWLPAWIPAMFKPLVRFNPFSYPIWVSQDIFYYGRFEHPAAWIVFLILSLISFGTGYRVFRRLKPFVANVL